MGECKLDHNLEDVRKKLAEQSPFLPTSIAQQLEAYLKPDVGQATLNEIFHLLKKYDLASREERADRERKLHELLG
jgi:hypothetical protein